MSGRWIIYRPDMAEPVEGHMAVAEPALPPARGFRSPLLRRVNTYRRAGVLVGLLRFLGRRDKCRGCDLARRLASHPGLYGCGACSTCTGGPERLLQEQSTCQRGLWPS